MLLKTIHPCLFPRPLSFCFCLKITLIEFRIVTDRFWDSPFMNNSLTNIIAAANYVIYSSDDIENMLNASSSEAKCIKVWSPAVEKNNIDPGIFNWPSIETCEFWYLYIKSNFGSAKRSFLSFNKCATISEDLLRSCWELLYKPFYSKCVIYVSTEI